MQQIAKQARTTRTDWALVRQGANHELWQYGNLRITIPRHADINERTANSILKTVEEAK